MKRFRNIIWIIALITIIALISVVSYGYYKNITMEIKNPIATMEIENFGTVKFELYPDQAPESVANFIALSNRGFYDGLTFHRVVKDFMIQGGDKNGDGSGTAKINNIKDGGEDKAYSIKGEFISNGVNNKVKFQEGVLAMARNDYTQYSSDLTKESYNSAGSQFFIMTKENTTLNGSYAPFGKVIEGLDVIHKIEEIEVVANQTDEETGEAAENAEISKPVNAPVIKSIRVDTQGVSYELPQLLTPFDYMTWLYAQYGIDPSSLGE